MSVAEPDPAAASEDVPAAAPTGAVARIQSVEIENLRGIKSGKLEGLAPLTVLTGPNGSGKSTVLDALYIGGSAHAGLAVHLVVELRIGVSSGPRWLTREGRGCGPTVLCKGAGGEFLYRRIEVGESPGGSPKVEVLGLRDKAHAQAPYRDSVVYEDSENPNISGGGYGSSKDWPLKTLRDVRLVLPNQGGDGTFLYSEAVRMDGKAAVVDVLRGMDGKAEGLDVLTERNGSPVLYVSYPKYSLPITATADGVSAATFLSMQLLQASSCLVAIEEPETHLHPAAMVLVAKAIVNAVRSGTQVVLTTHSIEFIDRLVDEVGEDAAELLALFTMNLRDGELLTARFPGEDVVFCRDEIGKDLR